MCVYYMNVCVCVCACVSCICVIVFDLEALRALHFHQKVFAHLFRIRFCFFLLFFFSSSFCVSLFFFFLFFPVKFVFLYFFFYFIFKIEQNEFTTRIISSSIRYTKLAISVCLWWTFLGPLMHLLVAPTWPFLYSCVYAAIVYVYACTFVCVLVCVCAYACERICVGKSVQYLQIHVGSL